MYDFNSSTLGAGWTFVNPVGDGRYSLTNNPGHLQISVPAGVPHDCWTGLDRCPRMVRNAAAGDATYEVKIDGNPLTSNYQVYGIFLYQNSTNYLRFEYWYGLGNLYVKAWKIINGTGSEAIGGPVVVLTGADSLQVTKTGNTYLLKYKLGSTGTWQTAGSFVQSGFSPAQVGIGVINEGSNLATTAQVDYFSITSP
jgi:hypothetical protein